MTGVHLGTQHGAKGLQWPVVFVLGDTSERERRADPDGELRLAYVAATRARQALYLLEWPGCRPAWTGLPDLLTVAATVPHHAWRPVERVVVGLGDLWLDYAGRRPAGAPEHRALGRLTYGSLVRVVEEGNAARRRLSVVTGDHRTVAVLSDEASRTMGRRLLGAANVQVTAMLQRTAAQTSDPKYRQQLQVTEWWVPLLVAELVVEELLVEELLVEEMLGKELLVDEGRR